MQRDHGDTLVNLWSCVSLLDMFYAILKILRGFYLALGKNR